MRESINKVQIEGLLSEVDLNEKVDKNGNEYIKGTVKIRVETNRHGVAKLNEIPIAVFCRKYKNNGEPNPAYDNVTTLRDEFTSIAAGGIEQASGVRVTSGKIAMNEYYSRSGNQTFVSYPIISAAFFSKVDRSNLVPTADFTSELFITKMEEEMDKEGIPTGRLKMQGAIIGYADRLDLITFILDNEEAIHHVKTYYEKGKTVKIQGFVNFSQRTETYEEPVGFGEPIVKTRTIKVSELIVTSGCMAPYEDSDMDNMAYDPADITKGMKARKERLEASKNVAPVAKSSPAKDDWGF